MLCLYALGMGDCFNGAPKMMSLSHYFLLFDALPQSRTSPVLWPMRELGLKELPLILNNAKDQVKTKIYLYREGKE